MPRTKSFYDLNKIQNIINKCDVCFAGMVDDKGKPYVLPFNFAYDKGIIYLHSAPEGKKIDILRKNSSVCIAFNTDNALRFTSENVACSYGMKFRSVVAYGEVEFIDDYDEKVRVLNLIMKKYTGKEFIYNAPAVINVNVMCVKVSEISGRESGY